MNDKYERPGLVPPAENRRRVERVAELARKIIGAELAKDSDIENPIHFSNVMKALEDQTEWNEVELITPVNMAIEGWRIRQNISLGCFEWN